MTVTLQKQNFKMEKKNLSKIWVGTFLKCIKLKKKSEASMYSVKKYIYLLNMWKHLKVE